MDDKNTPAGAGEGKNTLPKGMEIIQGNKQAGYDNAFLAGFNSKKTKNKRG